MVYIIGERMKEIKHKFSKGDSVIVVKPEERTYSTGYPKNGWTGILRKVSGSSGGHWIIDWDHHDKIEQSNGWFVFEKEIELSSGWDL